MRTTGWMFSFVVTLGIGSLLVTSACQSQQAASAPAPAVAPPEYTPTATIKDIMQSVVDPNADVVWLAVTTVQSAKGTVDTAPKTDEEWTKVRHGAIALTEAANLLIVPGRHVARPGEKSETPGVELEPSEMEALINKDIPAFRMRAKALHEAGLAALQAVDAKDAQKVFEVGEQIEQACENCHKQYWYPNEKIPPVPGEIAETGAKSGAANPAKPAK
ncbi:MAG TPA: hypothetical protein VKB50_02815 [Vicinamibacterales bacterium]|nr:hypothetical protein [Vicinamibacterales bacterium]